MLAALVLSLSTLTTGQVLPTIYGYEIFYTGPLPPNTLPHLNPYSSSQFRGHLYVDLDKDWPNNDKEVHCNVVIDTVQKFILVEGIDFGDHTNLAYLYAEVIWWEQTSGGLVGYHIHDAEIWPAYYSDWTVLSYWEGGPYGANPITLSP